MEYYLEYIFAENFFIDFILLYMTGNLIKRKIIYKRIAVSSFIGAVYVIMVALINREFLKFFIVKFSVSILMIIIAYDAKGIITYIRIILCFYIVSFIMAGIVTSLAYFAFDRVSISIIVVSMFFVFLFIKFLFYEIKTRKEKNNYMREVVIRLGDKIKILKAYIDTGNELMEPLLQKPVIIVNINSIKEIIGEDFTEKVLEFYNFKNISYDKIFQEEYCDFRIRVIKYNTISTRDERMLCIIPDEIIIVSEDKNILKVDAVIGINPQKISQNDDYEALLFKKLLDLESEIGNEI